VDPDPQQIERYDPKPDPHQRDKLGPDQHPHHRDKLNNVWKMSLFGQIVLKIKFKFTIVQF
jgi:hypothetical protein